MKHTLLMANVVVHYGYAGNNTYGWAATIECFDDRFAQSQAVEVTLNTKYYEPTLTQAIDTVWSLAQQLGIEVVPTNMALFYKGDGEDNDYPPPANFREQLQEEAEKRLWRSYANMV